MNQTDILANKIRNAGIPVLSTSPCQYRINGTIDISDNISIEINTDDRKMWVQLSIFEGQCEKEKHRSLSDSEGLIEEIKADIAFVATKPWLKEEYINRGY